jgi:hypothetical protein
LSSSKNVHVEVEPVARDMSDQVLMIAIRLVIAIVLGAGCRGCSFFELRSLPLLEIILFMLNIERLFQKLAALFFACS